MQILIQQSYNYMSSQGQEVRVRLTQVARTFKPNTRLESGKLCCSLGQLSRSEVEITVYLFEKGTKIIRLLTLRKVFLLLYISEAVIVVSQLYLFDRYSWLL